MTQRLGPQTPGKAHPSPIAHDLPADLAAVVLVDARTCAALGAMSISWWYEKVATGKAPQPAFRKPRCTRWRAKDVAEFWREFASQADDEADAKVKACAEKASAAALAN